MNTLGTPHCRSATFDKTNIPSAMAAVKTSSRVREAEF
jgi:hypothetical protein